MLLLSACGGPHARVTKSKVRWKNPGGTTGVGENPIGERYRESWREREARRRAEAEARRAAAQEAAERAIRAVAPAIPASGGFTSSARSCGPGHSARIRTSMWAWTGMTDTGCSISGGSWRPRPPAGPSMCARWTRRIPSPSACGSEDG